MNKALKNPSHIILDGKITKALLKTRSGEFDIESIHTLNLRDCGKYISLLIKLDINSQPLKIFNCFTCILGTKQQNKKKILTNVIALVLANLKIRFEPCRDLSFIIITDASIVCRQGTFCIIYALSSCVGKALNLISP